ncbi:MAG TPA: AI-2E family transporter [Ktedonobacteraceae bacterium]
MEQREQHERNTNDLSGAGQATVGDATGNEYLNVEAASSKNFGRSRVPVGRVLAGLQAARKALMNPARSVRTASEAPLPKSAEEVSDEPAQADTLSIDVTRWVRRVLIPLAILAWAGVAILILNAAGYVAKTLLLLVIAMLLAYALSPLVTFLARTMPRFLAILIVYLLVLGVIGMLFYFIVRTTVDQIVSLSHYVGTMLTPGKNGHPSALEQTLRSLGISQDQITSAKSRIINQAEGLAGNIVPLLTGVAGAALDIIVVAVMSIYLLIDGRRVTNWLRQNMPRRQQGRIRFLLETLQRVVGGYIRGQLFLCTLIGLLVGVGMQIMGVPYALLLGVLAFILEFIPVLGTLVSGAICVLFALTKGWLLAVIVLAYFVVVHIIEGDVVGPRVVGKVIGLHPVVSLAALIAGGELFGIWGILFAAPVAGVIQAFLIAIWYEWHETHRQAFQTTKDQVAEQGEKNIAHKPLDPEPEARLLS